MANNIARMFLLVISFAGGIVVAAESKQVGTVRKISDTVTVQSAGPEIAFCNNPGKHKAMVTDKDGWTLAVEGPFRVPKQQEDMWTVFITASKSEKILSNRFVKAIHSVEWIDGGDVRVTLCDGNFCFLKPELE